MTTFTPPRHDASVSSMLLANFAAAWGFVVAPLYLIGFGLMLPYVLDGTQDTVPTMALPLELPLIGLALSALSLALARRGSWDNRVACFWGLVLNGIPMALAIALGILGGYRPTWWSF